ncbi:gluconolaconase, partial [Pseudomonas sp. FW306-02-H05-AA]
LYVGDRSGTIFKINPNREIFVFATLEPSIAAYHLAFDDTGTLYVTGPTTSSNQAIHAIDRDGNTTIFYQGLGRAQGMAFDVAGNLYV